MLLLEYFIFLKIVSSVTALTGHVCSRQVAETYLTSYNKAFICPERYTTACGQLDWRRCTKYRVQTCYTPTERYAVRYRTVDGCCPGWRDGGDGVCSQPDCGGGCQNGGSCADVGGVVSCLCPDGYHGHRCELEKSSVDGWRVAILTCAVVIATAVVGAIILHVLKARNTLNTQDRRRDRDENETLLGESGDRALENVPQIPLTTLPATNVGRSLPSAPLED